MKVLPFKIPKAINKAIIFKEDDEPVFYNRFHQHNEIQISLLQEGTGTLIIGDSVREYMAGDIIVIGENLPHVFKSDLSLSRKSKMRSLFFSKSSFGQDFFSLEELENLNLFFEAIQNGVKILSNKIAIEREFMCLKEDNKFDCLIGTLKILKLISTARIEELSSYMQISSKLAIDGDRMRKIIAHTMLDFKRQISLEEIAEVANLTPNAFCRYFKSRTDKTYFQFLNEVRIDNASKMLRKNHDASIAEICMLSGFNNISNFNRQFKRIKKCTPKDYRYLIYL